VEKYYAITRISKTPALLGFMSLNLNKQYQCCIRKVNNEIGLNWRFQKSVLI
jgi:hypothetical protein